MTHWSRSQHITFAINLLATLLLITSLVLGYALPSYLHRLHLSTVSNQMLTLNLISLLLLTSYLQRSLSGGWRLYSLIGSFVVMAESCLIAIG